MTGYSRKFIKIDGLIVEPLTTLLRKDAFNWSMEASKAFEALKKAMINPPILALLDFSKPFIIECDTSSVGIGIVLMQGGRPLAYLSQALRGKALDLSTSKKRVASSGVCYKN